MKVTFSPSEISTAASVRSYIVDALHRELVGPDPGHPFVQWSATQPELTGEEVLRPQDPPRFRYACGILFPNGVQYSGSQAPTREEADAVDTFAQPIEETDAAPPELEEEDGGGEDEGEKTSEREIEPEVEPASMLLPSTLGISFLVSGNGALNIRADWATYVSSEFSDYATTSPGPTRPQKARNRTLWLRRPASKNEVLSIREVSGSSEAITRRLLLTPKGTTPSLELDIVSRGWSLEQGGGRLITLTLMNTTPPGEEINQSCFFQCKLRVTTEGGAVVQPYPASDEAEATLEELKLRLLYRHRPVFAVGHGCAADWKADAEGSVAEVRTEVLPVYEQAPIVPREKDEAASSPTNSYSSLSLRWLSEADRAQIVTACGSLAADYREWIAAKSADVEGESSLSTYLQKAALENLESCRECLSRIECGTKILQQDDVALHAFKLMNRAMVEQREHYALGVDDKMRRSWIKTGDGQKPNRDFIPPEYPYATKWRPFQLAFILMNLKSFVEPTSTERDLVDVIWFPTGGGKTEAYLGLAAFAILLRRLQSPQNGGTTVLMRYTLRLLTTQQFQRAASLTCALERIRREQPGQLGELPITIGLWLGSGVTPNRNQQAVEEWNKLARGEPENKFVILSCPWCGMDMGPREYGDGVRTFGYEKLSRPAQVRFRCEDGRCDFSGESGLPLEVVDERIYENPPTMVIGTVDKFAMLPWEINARTLFGRAPGQTNDPPDLIIQDELHLISGPLGSMVGHYETVIDALCRRRSGSRTIGPKIVASTATIARAEEQVLAVFARKARLFPPQGLRAGDSFFAEERSDLLGRLYAGVFATALPSHVTAQVHTVAALLQAPALLEPPALANAVSNDARDPYWTLMIYFNSLRELGRAATLVQADIREHLNAVWDRIGLTLLMENNGEPGKALRRFINRPEELTSRVRSSDVPAILQKLFTAYPDEEVIDLCLATNMIQVGLDVPRLSLMTIVGQPKTASEYIQASSRVGRAKGRPGLVVTNFNPFKPRDRSHFESFRSFHENIYRYVEPTSVTPFSIPVCERAIHALAVALARTLSIYLSGSPQAGISRELREQIETTIMQRVQVVSPDEFQSASTILRAFLDDWDRVRPQYYGSFGQTPPPGVEPMLWPAGKARSDYSWTITRDTPSSMRSVDAECEAWAVKEYPGATDV